MMSPLPLPMSTCTIHDMNKSPTFFVLHKGPVGELPSHPSKAKYPFSAMEVGHYFDVPRSLDHCVRVRASAQAAKRGHKYWVHRMTSKLGIPFVRVHRIA